MRSHAVRSLLLATLAANPALAATYDFAVDVPSSIGGAERLPNVIVHRGNSGYALGATLDPGVAVGAVSRRSTGLWLFVPRHAVTLGGITYETRDVVSFDGSAYAMVLDGSSAGIPDGAAIDALFEVGGATGLSFDVPVTIAGTDYGRSDLVTFAGQFSLYWDAEPAGVEAGANVCGADVDAAGLLVLAFDAPTLLSGTFRLPGELVSWNGAAFASYASDGSWPPSAVLRDFSFAPGAGQVPATGTPLTAIKLANGDVRLDWRGSCLGTDTDYEVYEGTIGSWYSHASRLCTTGGAVTATLTPVPGLTYYLVVPRNGAAEGSYGTSSSGVERPAGSGACLEKVVVGCS